MTRNEKQFSSYSGYLALIVVITLAILAFLMLRAFQPGLAAICAVSAIFIAPGLYMLQPNESAVLMLFGHYIGTDRSEGLRWAFPLYLKKRLSLRARNLIAPTLKVNDKRGNPIEISAAIVWRVRDTAQAIFDVDDFERYVAVQAEAAIRHLASLYAYDEGEDLRGGETTLRSGMDEVAHALKSELTERIAAAGVEIMDAKLTHLAYAPEIAQVMLRRQQAEAIISARQKIVHGAVSMVEAALKGLAERDIVELDAERKAAMVSNLLVVLCSDKDTQPIVNTGTLYN
ncbi:SPFH domain-containing protein [Pseudoduganella violaceinigra]|uniref:SPFH domain-containing protein n=1 Tax=Pseudoduganella violaceinigra TaxID=246602 RepID=UPI000415182A|nr:SPFH domain-containing protein [Pseudoduganella violaceinigra]